MTSENIAPKRVRQRGVRGRILELLAAGPLLAQELVDRGGFSTASLYLNLKALKVDGAIDTHREGRVVRYLLSGAAPDKGGLAKRGRAAITAAGSGVLDGASGELKAALNVLLARLSPIDSVDEKIMVLSQLAGSLPPPVSRVLLAVVDDLDRLTGKG